MGEFKFSRDQALELGQQRAFELNLQRLAFVPISAAWFPGLNQPDKGIQGHAPKRVQHQIWQAAEVILTRHAELVERLGPLWPNTRRWQRGARTNVLFVQLLQVNERPHLSIDYS